MGTDRIPRMYQVIHSPSIQQADDAKVGVGACLSTSATNFVRLAWRSKPTMSSLS